ncbi:hypothetical protein Sphch_3705 [Sphingobium chlorophenolicum L-1]|uniref:Uncharacterized protein n=1 Tax=Sphingobium chlorophenolicum L-1 TaxID=690566 RepID=F6F172_SPHCR|nr:hypothetical protein [Sphingobium chlorophenolicum]AEG51288.1 hypothetical protein Sphch_3705 [Sphingobium chlorophenolicum L-1]
MKNPPNTVPAEITLDLMHFCRRIADTVPVFVTSVPLRSSGASFCFDNVERKIAKSGGSIAYGWAIWHIPNLYYEAEHHAVWRNKLGSLIDVSPQLGGRRRLLFLPDEKAVYDSWKPRSNIMLPASDTPLAIEMARLGGARQALFARCRIPGTAEMRFYEQEQLELADLNQRIEQLMILAGVVV